MEENHNHTWIQWKIQNGRRKIHKLINGEIAFLCAKPDCGSFKQRSLVLGIYSECPNCHRLFILTVNNMKQSKPKCDGCRNTKKGKSIRLAKEMLIDMPQGEVVNEIVVGRDEEARKESVLD